MGRAPCCDKANVKRGPWSPEEDEFLKSYIEQHGTGGNWISLPSKAGLRRCGKSCRLRWLNYLRPDIKHGNFTEEEDRTILSLYNEIGSRWSIIASKLHGRTDNDVKNHWNTNLKKLYMMKKHNACSISSDHESYTFAKFPSMKTETHQESMANMVQGVSWYGSSLSFDPHVGYMVPIGLNMPTYASKTPSSADSEMSNSSSMLNAGSLSWPERKGSGVEDGGFLLDMLNCDEYSDGVYNGYHLFQYNLEGEDQKSSIIDELGSFVMPTPSHSAMLSGVQAARSLSKVDHEQSIMSRSSF